MQPSTLVRFAKAIGYAGFSDLQTVFRHRLRDRWPDYEDRLRTLNDSGAMLGWEMSPDQLGNDRPDISGPMGGLYYTGHWTRPGGGITPVIISAMKAAEAITGNRYF